MPGEAIAKIAANAYVLRLELPERHARLLRRATRFVIGSRELSGSDTPSATDPLHWSIPSYKDGRVIADAQAEGSANTS